MIVRVVFKDIIDNMINNFFNNHVKNQSYCKNCLVIYRQNQMSLQ